MACLWFIVYVWGRYAYCFWEAHCTYVTGCCYSIEFLSVLLFRIHVNFNLCKYVNTVSGVYGYSLCMGHPGVLSNSLEILKYNLEYGYQGYG